MNLISAFKRLLRKPEPPKVLPASKDRFIKLADGYIAIDPPCFCCHQGNVLVVKSGRMDFLLCPVTDEELGLDAGRFVWFREEEQEHVVTVRYNRFGSAHFDWVGDNVTAPWSLREKNDRIAFSFARADEAVHFKLRWIKDYTPVQAAA
jgi:hypothetical protein